MGRFTCVSCGSSYYDKRFLWEPDAEEDAIGTADDPASSSSMMSSCNAVATVEETQRNGTDDGRVYADTVRATGTMANITGYMAPTVAGACAPLSVVGGAVGISSGAAQLKQGLTMPSGELDPHLVAKGGITSAVGGACVVLGASAAFVPSLFGAAIALGVTGLGTATFLDAKMNGLCMSCRQDQGADLVEQREADDGGILKKLQVRRTSHAVALPASSEEVGPWWDTIAPKLEVLKDLDKLFDSEWHDDSNVDEQQTSSQERDDWRRCSFISARCAGGRSHVGTPSRKTKRSVLAPSALTDKADQKWRGPSRRSSLPDSNHVSRSEEETSFSRRESMRARLQGFHNFLATERTVSQCSDVAL